MDIERAPKGGKLEYGRLYKGGEILPFYVPREHMPQIDAAYLPLLISEALANTPNGVDVRFEAVPTDQLMAHQRVNMDKVRKLEPGTPGMCKPVLVSADDYILDGNHRWAAHNYYGIPYISCIRIGLVFDKGIEWLLSRNYCYEITPHTPERS